MGRTTTAIDIPPCLARAARIQMESLMAQLRQRGFADFTSSFAIVMQFIDGNGTRVTELARCAGVSKQAVSQLVRALEARDYVETVVDPLDTRAKLVRLTERGNAARQACAEIRTGINRLAVKALGRDHAIDLQQSLATLADVLRTPEDPG